MTVKGLAMTVIGGVIGAMSGTATPVVAAEPSSAAERCCAVVELRQYLLKPGRRDDLIAVFEEHLLESQEEFPTRVIGEFRNRHAPDRFVWLRGFPDMQRRHEALTGFYGGPVWAAHRGVANDTMIDSDDVLLLRPADSSGAFQLTTSLRPARGAPEGGGGLVILTIYSFAAPVDASFLKQFDTDIGPAHLRAGATILARYVTEASANTFPRLPVREGENVFVWVTSFASDAKYSAYRTALQSDSSWTRVAAGLRGQLIKDPEVLELEPAPRSLLRHGTAR